MKRSKALFVAVLGALAGSPNAFAAEPVDLICLFSHSLSTIDPTLPLLHLQIDYDQKRVRDVDHGQVFDGAHISDTSIFVSAPLKDRTTIQYTINRMTGVIKYVQIADGSVLYSYVGTCDIGDSRKF